MRPPGTPPPSRASYPPPSGPQNRLPRLEEPPVIGDPSGRRRLPGLLAAGLLREPAAGHERVPVGTAGGDLAGIAEDCDSVAHLAQEVRTAEDRTGGSDAGEERAGDAVAVGGGRAREVQALDGRLRVGAQRAHLAG